jgi:hypothetical protein
MVAGRGAQGEMTGGDATLKTKAQQSIEIAGLLLSILVAGIGFEPMTFRL